jgi:CxxC-x17-CxxC domain-containing protein
MDLQEKSITCFDCETVFTFTVEEQTAFQVKGYTNAPKRCPSCREKRKTRQLKSGVLGNIQPGFHTERQMFPVTCSQCGKETQVPFQPRQGRPVYCRDCFSALQVSR